jgi:hypothetical protein
LSYRTRGHVSARRVGGRHVTGRRYGLRMHVGVIVYCADLEAPALRPTATRLPVTLLYHSTVEQPMTPAEPDHLAAASDRMNRQAGREEWCTLPGA